MGHYADKVQLLNSARIQGRVFPLLHEFSEVERHAGGDVSYGYTAMIPRLTDFIRYLASFLMRTEL